MSNQFKCFSVLSNLIEKSKFVLILILSSFGVSVDCAQCNTCSIYTSMACVSETQYQACVNGIPTGAVNTCPSNYICSTAPSTVTAAICRPRSLGIAATCGSCNICSANGVFACTGVNTYALCLGANSIGSVTGSCGTSLVCNINLSQICGDPNMGTVATCSLLNGGVTTTTPWTPSLTTPSTLPTYAQYLCQQIRINGRFPLPTEMDRTCKRYIYCFLTTNSTWSGQIYTCAGSTYFDPYSRYCVANLPTGCSRQ